MTKSIKGDKPEYRLSPYQLALWDNRQLVRILIQSSATYYLPCNSDVFVPGFPDDRFLSKRSSRIIFRPFPLAKL